MIMQRAKRCLAIWQRQHLLIIMIVILLMILALKQCCNQPFPKRFGFASGLCTNSSSILRYITYVPRGGLGNRLFEYASTYGLSRQFGLQLVMHDDNLERVFGSSLTAMRTSTLETGDKGSQSPIRWFDEFEAHGSSFDRNLVKRLEVLRTSAQYCDEHVGIRLHGYLQSFRYFEMYLTEIRAQYSFTESQFEAANAFVEAVRNHNLSAYSVLSNTRLAWDRFASRNANDNNSSVRQRHDALISSNVQHSGVANGDELAKSNDGPQQRYMGMNGDLQRKVVVVGVHVRRGDMVNNMQMVSAGYQTADYRYLLNATRYFRRMFAERGVSVRFFVSSNDVPWAQEYFPFRRDAVFSGADTQSGLPAYFMEHAATTVKDLLILAHCDALILTVGSYGFWAAILGNGHKPITYYARPYRSGSLIELAHNYSVSDYYPPHWLGMTG